MPGLKATVIAAILVVAAALRLVALDRVPLPVQQDELSDIYDGWAIAETGAERAGIRYPMIIRAFGEADYRPPLYPWLAAVPAAVTGFSIVGGRLPSAILGCAALLLLWAFAKRLGGSGFALVALALAALSPWLVLYSRVAHQGAMLPPFFFILILYLWERASARSFAAHWLIALGLALGLSTSAYQSTKLTALLLAICIAIFILRHDARPARSLAFFGVAVLAGALPQVFVLVTDPAHFMARSQDTLVKAESLPAVIAEVLRNFGLNIGPRYLFVPNMDETYLTSARLLPVELLMFYPGLLAIRALRGPAAVRFRPWLYASLVIAILPAALNNQNPHSLRASSLAALTPLFSASTVMFLREWLRGRRILQVRTFDILFGASVASSAALVAFMYFRSPTARGERMQHGIALAAERVGVRQHAYDRVFFENTGYQPYLYVVSFTGMTPEEYMAAPKEMGASRGRMDVVRRVGKYFFLDSAALARQAARPPGTASRDLFVGRSRLPMLTVLDTAGWQSQKYYLMERLTP